MEGAVPGHPVSTGCGHPESINPVARQEDFVLKPSIDDFHFYLDVIQKQDSVFDGFIADDSTDHDHIPFS